jgi:hypothetical protein
MVLGSIEKRDGVVSYSSASRQQSSYSDIFGDLAELPRHNAKLRARSVRDICLLVSSLH